LDLPELDGGTGEVVSRVIVDLDSLGVVGLVVVLHHHGHEAESVHKGEAIGVISIHQGSAERLHHVFASDKPSYRAVRLNVDQGAGIHEVREEVTSDLHSRVLPGSSDFGERGSKADQKEGHPVVRKGLRINHHNRLRRGAGPTLILVSHIQEERHVAADLGSHYSRDDYCRSVARDGRHIIVIECLGSVWCREEGAHGNPILNEIASLWYQGHRGSWNCRSYWLL
jgi:hypothetical protein